MHEHLAKPKTTFARLPGMPWLVDFLNLKFEPGREPVPEKIREFLRRLEATRKKRKRQIEAAWNVQQRFMQLVAPIAERQPQASRALDILVNALNQWALSTKVHPYWFLSSLDRARRLEPGQPIMEIGDKRWVIEADLTPRGAVYTGDPIEGRVWTVLAKCLQAGELDRLRRCRECRCFFFAQHLRKSYCTPEHQKQHDSRAARVRVKKWRASAPKRQEIKEAEAKEKSACQRFADFLAKAGGTTKAQMSVGPVTKQIPGGWKTINGWLEERKTTTTKQIWQGLSNQERKPFLGD